VRRLAIYSLNEIIMELIKKITKIDKYFRYSFSVRRDSLKSVKAKIIKDLCKIASGVE